jgi:hypothetical protein
LRFILSSKGKTNNEDISEENAENIIGLKSEENAGNCATRGINI